MIVFYNWAMKDTLPYLINLPPFMQKDTDLDSLNVLKKSLFVIKGKLVGFIVNKTDGKLFCSLINLLFRADGKIFYEDGKYYKISKNKDNIYYITFLRNFSFKVSTDNSRGW